MPLDMVYYSNICSHSMVYFFIPVFGKTLKVLSEDGSFTKIGIGVSCLIAIISIGIALLNNRYASHSEFGELEKLRGHIAYLEFITKRI